MNYPEKLKQAYKKFDSIVCMGLDPVIEDIPLEGKPGEIIVEFYEAILNKIVQKKIYPGAVKPNHAFYARHGLEGIEALKKVTDMYKNENIPVILDVKRGDIGKTAKAYADEAFDYYNADAVTLSPYLGLDSIEPFMTGYPDKGYYVLTKTSNKSSSEIQDIEVNGNPLYEFIANKIIEWYKPGIASVVGATYPEQLSGISRIFIDSGKEVPLLIPGIGTQGGSLEEVLNCLKEFPDMTIHRINSSSAINYAYKKMPDMTFDEAAVKALDELNKNIQAG